MISRMLPALRRLLDPPNAQQYFEIYVPVCKGNINIQVRQNGNGKIYISFWNSLPRNIRNSPSLSQFKSSLKKNL